MMDFLDDLTIRIVFITIHIGGIIVAAGAAFFFDMLFMETTKDGVIDKKEYALLQKFSGTVWVGLFVAIPSGVGLFALAPDVYLASSSFLAKVTILTILIINGIIFHIHYLPKFQEYVGKKAFVPTSKIRHTSQLVPSGVVSVVSWIFVVLLGALMNIQFGYALIMLTYLAAILIGLLVASKAAQPMMNKLDRKALRISSVVVALILFASVLVVWQVGSPEESLIESTIDEVSVESDLLENIESDNNDVDSATEFTIEEIAEHADAETDCWIYIDNLVFDISEASKFHPAQFPNCGGDATENYFKNHAPSRVIRDKQMAFLIGDLASGTEKVAMDDVEITGPSIPEECEAEDRAGDETAPTTELFVEEGSWNTEDIMIVIEKSCRSLLFVDGTTHTTLGRISDIGHQMHAPTVSNDGQFMYIVARDGIVSKVDLTNFETLIQTRVGTDSRGTGLTDDGKYLLIGNFEPHTAVLLDTSNLEILKEYQIETTLNGEEITSRVGGIAQLGSKLYVVIKDANQVWVIDTAQDDFPVVRKYEDMGQVDGVTTPPLHDIYLTPDGEYVIAAVQDSAVAWVLNAETGEVVSEVPTGETPHTGPGATVDNLTFVPTLDETGIISVIDTDTWTNVMNISTGGPSLFIRHNPTAETSEEYGYVWGEAAFGDRHDEIYLINIDWVKEGKDNPIEYTLKPVPGESSWHPEFTYDGKYVYVVSMTGNQVVVYDADTFEVVKRIQSGTPSSVINVGSRQHEPGL